MKPKSEEAFESFLRENNLAFEKIQEQTSPRPDYIVQTGETKLVFEVKEIREDDDFAIVSGSGSSFRIPGEHVRKKIRKAAKQIQFGSKQGLPVILLLYNNLDPLHMFGTEDLDFTSAMYGEITVLGDGAGVPFHGGHRSVSEADSKLSALGRLRPYDLVSGKMAVTLFENVFAKVKVPYESLPSCFQVVRVRVSD